jgi:hypothetical protein
MLLLLAVCIFFPVKTVTATTFVVANVNDSGAGSLREAISNANLTSQPDEIVFDSAFFDSSKTITLTSGELRITQPLKILGPGAKLLQISGNLNSRVFFLTKTALVTLSNLTISNGKAPVFSQSSLGNYGGGIYIDGGQLYLTQVTVADCRAEQGGGIYNGKGTFHIVESIIRNNQALDGRNDGSYGGGINNDGTLIIANSSIINNVAQGGNPTSSSASVGGGVGGGIYLYAGNMVITNSVISNNSAIGGNSTSGFGGNGSAAGILANGLSANISNTLFYNNQARAGTGDIPSRSGISTGGAITNGTKLELKNVTVSNNSVNSTNSGGGISGGGGIWNSCGGCMTVINSTIVNNTAVTLPGGGIYAYSGLYLRNTIVANNSAPFGPDVEGGLGSLGNNLIGNGADSLGLANGVNNDRVGTNTAPLNPMLAPLADNGGATQTYLPLVGSPVIDNGNNCVLQATADGGCLTDPLLTDQRGFIRLNPLGGIIDIGAVEYNSTPFTPSAPIAPDLESGSDLGLSNVDNFTSSLAPTFDVAGVPNQATVELLRNGVVVASAYSVNGGTVSLSDAPGVSGTFIYASRVVRDAATSTISTPLSIIIDAIRPTVTVTKAASQADQTDGQPLVFVADFSKPVYGLSASAISLAGSSAETSSAVISVSPVDSDGRRYNITVSNITSTGQVVVNIAANGASDSAGNSNVASTGNNNTVFFNLSIEVNISGRIIRNSGVARTASIITLIDNLKGVSYTARTNPFGYFRFNQVSTYQLTGRRFVFQIQNKNFSLFGQQLIISSDRSDININIP